jgi:pimeloyl-ACP methyl ester carboxylesterase
MVQTPVGSLAVRIRGEGAPALLWHSLFVDERSWERVETDLAADRQLVLVTGPGHGASTDPHRRYTMEECAEAARTVLDTVGISAPVDWVGNAWGGHVGAVFASRWPTRCRSLVTIGTPAQPLNAKERARTMLLLAVYRLLGPAAFIQTGVANVLLSATTRGRDQAAVNYVKECLADADRSQLRNAVISVSLHRDDLTPLLPRLTTPTLLITGAEHAGWTPQQARAASQLLAQGSSVVVPDAAYLPPLEAPQETANLIRHFWATRAAPDPRRESERT